MQFTLAIAALAAAAYAQECTKTDYSTSFVINPKNVSSSSKRDLYGRQSSACADITTTLKGGVLLNSKGSTGEIAANYQFQYDNPLQVDNKNHDGFSACDNGTLALNGNAVFYQCNVNEGPGLLYSPFLSPVTGQCFPVYFEIVDCDGSSSGSGGSVTVAADGQPQASSCVPATITKDGQVQVSSCPTSSSCVAATITKDGQVQVSSCPTSTPTSTCVAATITKDGQVQVSSCPTSTPTSTCVAATIISDGQPQVISCPTETPTSTCVAATITSDGQVQVSSCPASGVAAGTASAPAASSTFVGISAGNAIAVGSQVAIAMLGLAVVAFL